MLTASADDPCWIALALFCLARTAAVSALEGFKSMQWSEVDLEFFRLESAVLEGRGATLAAGYLRLNRKQDQLARDLGERMIYGLAEAAEAAPTSALFK